MRIIYYLGLAAMLLFYSDNVYADVPEVVFEQALDVQMNGVSWLRTVISPFDSDRPDQTYKVYTHLMDFEGAFPLTKGVGGRYPHHRGLFIGWNHTHMGGRVLDTWHMRAGRTGPDRERFVCQQWTAWENLVSEDAAATHAARIDWFVDGESPFIEEVRTLRVFPIGDSMRAVDFQTSLNSLSGSIELRGDPQHAGMQIRMAQEVADNEDETGYILPPGARVLESDVVEGAWWACGSMPIRGKRYWVLHMTSPKLVTGEPQYSIRKYGRFGAFFEPVLQEGVPLRLAFRIVWSEKPLDQDRCGELYRIYAEAETQAIP